MSAALSALGRNGRYPLTFQDVRVPRGSSGRVLDLAEDSIRYLHQYAGDRKNTYNHGENRDSIARKSRHPHVSLRQQPRVQAAWRAAVESES